VELVEFQDSRDYPPGVLEDLLLVWAATQFMDPYLLVGLEVAVVTPTVVGVLGEII
jgi:hypothetical protein